MAAEYIVATHTGGVDRNFGGLSVKNSLDVATHTGGVDRNIFGRFGL